MPRGRDASLELAYAASDAYEHEDANLAVIDEVLDHLFARADVAELDAVALRRDLRFVVTSRTDLAPRALYTWYVRRGEPELWIKDLKDACFADRLSCHRFWANQFRLLLHAAAYVLMYELRRAARGTELEDAQMDTLRLRLLKIGVQVASTARRIWFHLSSSYPWRAVWSLIARRLVHGPDG